LRKFADIFAYVNYTTYKEMIYYESYFVRSFISNFEDMSNKVISQITRNHEQLAEMQANFSDIRKICFKPKSVLLF